MEKKTLLQSVSDLRLLTQRRKEAWVSRNEADSIHVPQHGLGAGEQLRVEIILTIYNSEIDRLFGRLRFESNQAMQRKR